MLLAAWRGYCSIALVCVCVRYTRHHCNVEWRSTLALHCIALQCRRNSLHTRDTQSFLIHITPTELNCHNLHCVPIKMSTFYFLNISVRNRPIFFIIYGARIWTHQQFLEFCLWSAFHKVYSGYIFSCGGHATIVQFLQHSAYQKSLDFWLSYS